MTTTGPACEHRALEWKTGRYVFSADGLSLMRQGFCGDCNSTIWEESKRHEGIEESLTE